MLSRRLLFFFLFSCALLALVSHISSAKQSRLPTVLGIDFGSEYIKIGYVSRGKPIDLILNEQSKRKTSNYIAFRRKDERLFGANARQISSRFPASAARYYTQLFMGKRHELANDFLEKRCRKDFGINAWTWKSNDERGTIDFVLTGEDNVQQVYQSEELMAYMLRYIVNLIDKNTQYVSGVIINIPPYFSIEQRQAVRDAAKLAGVRLLGLMHESTSLAIQYGVSRFTKINKEIENQKNSQHNVIFFDMGATKTTASIVQYTPPKKNSILELGSLKVLSTKWNDSVGGEDFTNRIALHLAKKFQEKHSYDVTNKMRVMERLRGFAKKAKEVLTANADTVVFIETLYKDIDFRVSLTREELEEMCEDLLEQTLEPIRDAMTESKLKMKNIHALEAVGGGSRMIAIQDQLNRFFRKGISHSLNGDESIALGSALHAASLSPMFRVKSFTMGDAYPFGIDFTLSGSESNPEKTYSLFKRGDPMDFKRFINVPRKEDFDITLKYTDESRPKEFPEDGKIATYRFHNVKDSMSNFTNISEKDKDAKRKVRIGFELTPEGMLRLDTAQATLEQMVQVPIVPKKSSNASATNETKEEEVKYKSEKKVTKNNIEYNVQTHILPELSQAQLKQMKDRMLGFEQLEKKRELIAKSRNELESTLYSTQNMFYDDEYEPFYVEEESEKLMSLLNEIDDWLMETDEDGTVGVDAYQEKLKAIQSMSQPIIDRKEEVSKREQQVDACKDLFKLTRKIAADFEKTTPHVTEEEKSDLVSAVEETEQWLQDQLSKQEDIPLYQPPIVSHQEIKNQCDKLNTKSLMLLNKPKPEPEPEEPNTNSTKSEGESIKNQSETEEAPKENQDTEHDPKRDEL